MIDLSHDFKYESVNNINYLYNSGVAAVGGQRGLKKLYAFWEISLTEICVLMLARYPLLGYVAPLSARRANPGATPDMIGR